MVPDSGESEKRCEAKGSGSVAMAVRVVRVWWSSSDVASVSIPGVSLPASESWAWRRASDSSCGSEKALKEKWVMMEERLTILKVANERSETKVGSRRTCDFSRRTLTSCATPLRSTSTASPESYSTRREPDAGPREDGLKETTNWVASSGSSAPCAGVTANSP